MSKDKNSALLKSLSNLDKAWGEENSCENASTSPEVALVDTATPLVAKEDVPEITLLDPAITAESKSERLLREALEKAFAGKQGIIYIKLTEVAAKVGVSYVCLMAGKKKLEKRGLYKFRRGSGFSAVEKLY